jgi:hypothetical protein
VLGGDAHVVPASSLSGVEPLVGVAPFWLEHARSVAASATDSVR